jgi:hypothetical protein
MWAGSRCRIHILKKKLRFVLTVFKMRRRIDKMGLVVRMMNVGRGERIFRFATGVVLIALAFLVSGVSGWILGLLGVAIIPTAIFGY